MLKEATYLIAKRGLATNFTEAELPPNYASVMKNRFINAAGGAEKRQGVTQLGDTITGGPTITEMHELVDVEGSAKAFASGDGSIYRMDTSAWTPVYTSGDSSSVYQTVQFGAKLIFVNGVNRNIYTEDGTTFTELIALVEQGSLGAGTTATSAHDPDVTNWISTDVAVNDLLWNKTKNAYGVITAVTSAALTTTRIGGAAATGIGVATSAMESGDAYQIVDLVELNIIPAQPIPDNVGIAETGTSAAGVKVSGVNFANTEIRADDYIYNSTRAAVTRVLSVGTSALSVTSVSGQTAGDSLVFLKSAMPIADRAHVHFGRLYLIDSRDKKKIRISGANDPQDFSSDAGTLDSVSFSFGDLQPQGDTLLTMGSYQRFFVVAGRKNVYAYEGTTPIGTDADFTPVGLFPQGCVSPRGLVSIGNDMAFVTPDGLQSFTMVRDSSTLNRANLSEPLRNELRDQIADTPESQIVLFHYPRRSWLVLKIGSQLYVFNYTEFLGDTNRNVSGGSWSIFDNLFARQRAFLVRNNNDLICAGPGGKVYKFDSGVYADDGAAIDTEYRTGWLTWEEPKKRKSIKQLNYITPIVQTGASVSYTIRAESGFDLESTDTVTVATSGNNAVGVGIIGQTQIGGSSVQNVKYPLRVRGEVTRVTFTNSNTAGPDIISRFTLYGNIFGRR